MKENNKQELDIEKQHLKPNGPDCEECKKEKAIVETHKYMGSSTYNPEDILFFGPTLSPAQQCVAKCRGYFFMIIELTFLGVIYGVTNNHEDGAWNCSRDMVIWLYVFAGYLAAQFVYDLYYTIVFGYCKRSTEVFRCISDLTMTLVLYGFGLAWFIWGNILLYHPAWDCRNTWGDSPRITFRLFFAFIVIGYVFWAYQLCIYFTFIFQLVACIQIACKKRVSSCFHCLPYIRSLSTDGDKAEEKDVKECNICDKKYQDTEEITYLKCEKKHYFHKKCLEQYLQQTHICPYCLKEVEASNCCC